MIRKEICFLLGSLLLAVFYSHAQRTKRIQLSNELNEISGLVYADSGLIALNDGGNAPVLFFLNLEGKIVHSCTIANALNTDWESITIDSSGYVYIADCGNNLNKRDQFTIYRVPLNKARKEKTTQAEQCIVRVPYRDSGPVAIHQMDYDVEAINYVNGQLLLYTKSRAKPWHGKSYVYRMNWQKDSCQLSYAHELFIGNSGWMYDAVTGCDVYGDTEVLLTYKKLIWIENNTVVRKQCIPGWRQREGLAIDLNGTRYIASERQLFRKKPVLEIQPLK
jgi:hypothetical protein